MAHPRRRRRDALTLIDVVIVVLIMGIVSAVAVPRFADSLHRRRVDAAARRIKADLQWIRQTAMASSASLSVQFYPLTGTYECAGISHLDRPGRPYVVDLTIHPYQVQLATASFGGASTLQFNRYGQPLAGGGISVRSGGFQQTVMIHPDSGMASIP